MAKSKKRGRVGVVDGNTKSTTPKKQGTQAKYWCFTWNNYPADFFRANRALLTSRCSAWVIGREVGASGTKHLQGWLSFKKRCRWSCLKWKGCHFEKCKGNAEQNMIYCSKEGDYESYGCVVPPQPIPLALYDVDCLGRHQRALVLYLMSVKNDKFSREVFWFHESKGGWGKSMVALHLTDFHSAFVCSGTYSDIACGFKLRMEDEGAAPPVVVIDVPRSAKARVSYKVLEDLKNGQMYSGKYESGTMRFNRPRVLVFSNSEPVYDKLSQDRWRVRDLSSWTALMLDITRSGKCTEVYWCWKPRPQGADAHASK
ncbi:MAG: putative viral replication protein [Cressdnaviricota sp.]|nr:MAG: putative viral replication protein [Cressdnaviricota sp.]